jgi:hypothetical protein
MARETSLPAGTYFCLGNRLEIEELDLVEVGFDYIDCAEMVEDRFRILESFIYLVLEYELSVVVTRIIATFSVTRLKLVLTVVKYFTLRVDAK